MSPTAPLAIPELGLAYQIKTIVAGVQPGVIKDNPFKAGDVIKDYRFTYTIAPDQAKSTSWLSMSGKELILHLLGQPDETEKTSNWLPTSKPLDEADWARHGNNLLRSPTQITKIDFKVERDNKIVEISLTPADDKDWPLAERGLLLAPDTRREVAYHFYDAISLGLRDTWRGMKQV